MKAADVMKETVADFEGAGALAEAESEDAVDVVEPSQTQPLQSTSPQ